MPEGYLSYLVTITVGLLTLAGSFAAARFGFLSSITATKTESTTTLTIDERAQLRAEATALREDVNREMDRLRADNDNYRARLERVEAELQTTRMSNITLEHDRNRLADRVKELEHEVTLWTRRFRDGGGNGE